MSDPRVLAVDVGGRHVKFLASGEGEKREFASSDDLTAAAMAERVFEQAQDWEWDVVSVGVPAVVVRGRVAAEPVNLGRGWAGFDYEAAFGKPTRVVNDAVMQALGSWEGGRMLFLGLGTGLGSTWVDEDGVLPLELGHLPFRDATYEDYVSRGGRKRLGRKEWEKAVREVVDAFVRALDPDYVVLGGGAADKLGELPERCRLGGNENAFRGGFELWRRDPL